MYTKVEKIKMMDYIAASVAQDRDRHRVVGLQSSMVFVPLHHVSCGLPYPEKMEPFRLSSLVFSRQSVLRSSLFLFSLSLPALRPQRFFSIQQTKILHIIRISPLVSRVGDKTVGGIDGNN